jgi:hypothetical protein
MASVDFKQVEPLIKELSPPQEVKKTFYQTFFGSLVGQTYFFMGLLAIYLAVVAFLYTYAKAPLEAFRDEFGALWFWIILAAPLACILLFQMLPTALRAFREKRLRAMAIGGVPKPGYFRLQPYSASDHDVFSRLDGADREVSNWLKSTKSSLLYLSGASGVGKSSLLSAGVLPRLRDAGWFVSRQGYSAIRPSACAGPCWTPKEYSSGDLPIPLPCGHFWKVLPPASSRYELAIGQAGHAPKTPDAVYHIRLHTHVCLSISSKSQQNDPILRPIGSFTTLL